ncbi:MAG: hypothetical protein OXP71_01065 [Candidatus Poribacteria bacterium]|nr:hypothetical protein [Candidatus Poribacteria bacterium]
MPISDNKRKQLIDTISEAVERYGKQRPTGKVIMQFVNGLSSIPKKSDEPNRHLVVTMADGTIVENNTEYKTFHEVLALVGIARIPPILPKVVFRPRKRRSDVEIGGWYVRRYHGVYQMADYLERIKEKLKLKMTIDTVPKQQGDTK